MVDGLGVGDVGEVVMRRPPDFGSRRHGGDYRHSGSPDRKILKNPDIVSRGFIYLREHKNLLRI